MFLPKPAQLAILLALCIVCLPTLAWAGNCSLVSDYRLVSRDKNFVFATHGLSGTLSSAIDGEVQPTSINITITTSHVVERLKNTSSPTHSNCNIPTGFDSPYEKVDKRGSSFAPAVNYIELDYFDCYAHQGSFIQEGVKVDGIYFILSNASMPDFRFHIAFEISNGTLEAFPNNDTTNTQGEVYTNTWLADRVKITVKLDEIPWVSDPTLPLYNAPFLSIHFRLAIDVIPSTFSFCDTRTTKLTVNSTGTPYQQMQGEWEKFYMVDGVPYFTSEASGECEGDKLEGQFSVDNIWVGVGMCSRLFGQYRQLIYDPTLASAFTLTDPNNPDVAAGNPPLAKTNKVAVVVGASVGSVVIVGILVFVVLFITVEPIRNAVLPSTKSISNASASASRGAASRPAASSISHSQSSAVTAPKVVPKAAVSAPAVAPAASSAPAPSAKTAWTNSRSPTHQ